MRKSNSKESILHDNNRRLVEVVTNIRMVSNEIGEICCKEAFYKTINQVISFNKKYEKLISKLETLKLKYFRAIILKQAGVKKIKTEKVGKYTYEYIIWLEDFVDEDTGQVISITRRQRLSRNGVPYDMDSYDRKLMKFDIGKILNLSVNNIDVK